MAGVRQRRQGGSREPQTGTSTTDRDPRMQANDHKVIYRIPPLPIWEIALYFVIFVCHIVAACYYAWIGSEATKNQVWGGFFEPGWGGMRRDSSNYEWNIASKQAFIFLRWFAGHAFIFNCLEWPLGKAWRPALLCYWMMAALQIYCWQTLAVVWLFALFMLLVAQFRVRILIWIVACGLLIIMGLYANAYLAERVDMYLLYTSEVLIAYKLIQYISFTTNVIDPTSDLHRQPFSQQLYHMLFYSFYFPYTVSLIVPYPQFEVQMANRTAARDWPRLFLLAIRVAGWGLACELVLHYIYLNALFSDFMVLARVSIPIVCAVGYLAGQFFQVKYMFIFGVPSFFAKLDRMDPPWPPICISRVALYSQMWRYFDRGLYAFMRDEIFIPCAKPNFTRLGRLMGTVGCFGFVWLWHTPTSYYFVWILLNVIEVYLENFGKMLYRKPWFYHRIESKMSRANFRRLVALTHIPCVTLGIFSIWFFLGGMQTGMVFVRRLIVAEAPKFGRVAFHLYALGFCYAQVCMQIQLWETKEL